jgi:hypothetical protein
VRYVFVKWYISMTLMSSTLLVLLSDRGYNIGVRLIEDLVAKGNVGRCHDLRETADIIAKVRQTIFTISFS